MDDSHQAPGQSGGASLSTFLRELEATTVDVVGATRYAGVWLTSPPRVASTACAGVVRPTPSEVRAILSVHPSAEVADCEQSDLELRQAKDKLQAFVAQHRPHRRVLLTVDRASNQVLLYLASDDLDVWESFSNDRPPGRIQFRFISEPIHAEAIGVSPHSRSAS